MGEVSKILYRTGKENTESNHHILFELVELFPRQNFGFLTSQCFEAKNEKLPQDLLWPQLWISKDDLENLTTTKRRVYILKAKSPKSKLVCWWPFDLHTDPQIGFVPKF